MTTHPAFGLHPIRGLMGLCHLLVDNLGQAVLLDTGLFGEMPFLRLKLKRLGLKPSDLKAILLTHGHLDHAGNLAEVKALTGAPIYAHPTEQSHIDGTYKYQGINRWCGRLEGLGRFCFAYRPAQIDVPLHDGDKLPFWGGLRVVHLPGHTAGHCGFYSAPYDLLFSGDLFASYFYNTHLPPPILNSYPELIPSSVDKALALKPRRIIPNHYDFCDGILHRQRLEDLKQPCSRKTPTNTTNQTTFSLLN
jgi:glyoxylase-like metal-dependent hydrolase (beta-lactamase superfamily II)